MKSLRNRNDNNTSINKVTFTSAFTGDELNLFYDLIQFTLKYEEVFFNDDIDDEVLNLIDRIIAEKINSISPTLAFKFLNRLWTIYGEGISTLDAKIINDVDFDLTANRLSIDLLNRATDDESFFNNYRTRSQGLENYLNFNFYNRIYNIGSKANKMLILDHVELFIALLNESVDINNDLIDRITNKYLFLYKDIYREVLKNNLTKDTAVILSQRFNGYERYIMQHHTDIREENIALQFTFEAMVMLSYKDDELTPNDIEYLKVGKIYLDSLLMLLKEFEVDKVLSYYQEEENDIDTRECTKSLSYIKKSINEKDLQLKRNS